MNDMMFENLCLEEKIVVVEVVEVDETKSGKSS